MMKYGYNTTFDTATGTMTHWFHPRLQVILNYSKKKFTVIKDKKVMASIDIKDEVISLPDYVKILKSAAETALNFEKV